MGLENYKHINRENELAKELKEKNDGFRVEEGMVANNVIKSLDEKQLSEFIEKSFKKNDHEWLTYTEMKKNPFYTFMVQASIDLLSDKLSDRKYEQNGTESQNGKSLDDWLKAYNGIDNIYGEGTRKLVTLVQNILKITPVDGKAGEDFFKRVCEELNKPNGNNPDAKGDKRQTERGQTIKNDDTGSSVENQAASTDESTVTQDNLDRTSTGAVELNPSVVFENEIRDGDGKIIIDKSKKNITLQGIYFRNGQGIDKKIDNNIEQAYIKIVDDWVEIYSNKDKSPRLPRFKINASGNVIGRENKNSNVFDIKLDGYNKIFDALRDQLLHEYYDYFVMPSTDTTLVERTNPYKKEVNTDNTMYRYGNLWIKKSGGFELSGAPLEYGIRCFTNIYVKRQGNNDIYIYSCGEKEPKMILKQDGLIKSTVPNHGNTLYDGLEEDIEFWKNVWKEINENYDKYNHNDVTPEYIDDPYVSHEYVTKEDLEQQGYLYVSPGIDGDGKNPVKLNGNRKAEYENTVKNTVKNDKGDSPKQSTYENLGESYDDIIPSGVMKNSISQGEYKMLSYNTYAQANGLDMYKYNIKGTNNSFDRIGAGYSKINNNKYEINTGFMIDFSTKKLYVKNMGMNEYSDSNCVRWRDRVFDFSDITINNNSITIKGKDVTHTIKKTGYETNSNLKREVSLRPRRLFYSMVMENKEKFA